VFPARHLKRRNARASLLPGARRSRERSSPGYLETGTRRKCFGRYSARRRLDCADRDRTGAAKLACWTPKREDLCQIIPHVLFASPGAGANC
jgi:hypothetical protein